jgi:hypothetical protein
MPGVGTRRRHAELLRSHGSKAVDAHQHGGIRVWEALGRQINETSSCTDKPTVSLTLLVKTETALGGLLAKDSSEPRWHGWSTGCSRQVV